MALSVSPTLAELRNSVAIRMNMGVQASTSEAMHPVLDEYIRQAFNLLVNDCEWAIMNTMIPITLIDKQHIYEVPDGIAPGDIEIITIENTNKFEYPMASGVAYYERNAFRIDRGDSDDNPGQLPMRWEVRNQDLVIYPAPDAALYPTMNVYGKAVPREPYRDDDRSFIDKEAHITQAVIGLKTLYDMDTQKDEMLMARHERNVRAKQSDGEVVQIGPTPSARFAGDDRRSDGADNAFFYPDFDPFPYTLYT